MLSSEAEECEMLWSLCRGCWVSTAAKKCDSWLYRIRSAIGIVWHAFRTLLYIAVITDLYISCWNGCNVHYLDILYMKKTSVELCLCVSNVKLDLVRRLQKVWICLKGKRALLITVLCRLESNSMTQNPVLNTSRFCSVSTNNLYLNWMIELSRVPCLAPESL